ncbi:hypothetical protein HU200_040744 [Digitaria exilis]|uniref:Uncharacterized protein n=1 Tax=Digitaria exilis TaxID=1010633 RepID=A0A835EJB8_9POAL|nr:hypothetical protein HU200_040744 [Digitaria exilis]
MERLASQVRIAQEVALQLGVHRDQAFIRDELEMMLAFLMLHMKSEMSTSGQDVGQAVEDVSQRNVRYHLIKGSSPKPAIGAGPSIIYGATKFGIDEARRQKDKAKVDLSQLIDEGNTDLRVIAVWGANDSLGQTVIIKGEYDNLKRSKKFKLYAWIRILHPFNPLDFLQCIMRQILSNLF